MKELKKVCSMMGTMLTKEELDQFMAEADKVRGLFHGLGNYYNFYLNQDGNGKLDYDEFVKMLLSY